MIRVDLERCTGCEICVDSCRAGATRISDDHAVIDERLCQQCEACLDACPQGALSRAPVVIIPEAQPTLLPEPTAHVGAPATRPLSTIWRGRVLPLLGAVAGLAVREIAPRFADAIVRAPTPDKHARGATVGTERRRVSGGYRLRWRQRG